MNTYDFVHMVFLALGGSISGKTKLQKQVYFLGVMTGHDNELGYHAHHYGPYSGDVAAAVGQLQGLGFLASQSTTWGTDERGFEIYRTDYCLTSDGKEIAERKAEQHPQLWESLQDGVDALNKAGNLDYVQLSIAAKTYFVLRQKESPLSYNELVELAEQCGWNVTQEQVSEAVQYLQSLDLAQGQAA